VNLQQFFGLPGKVKGQIGEISVFAVATPGETQSVCRFVVCNILLESGSRGFTLKSMI